MARFSTVTRTASGTRYKVPGAVVAGERPERPYGYYDHDDPRPLDPHRPSTYGRYDHGPLGEGAEGGEAEPEQ